MVLARHHRTWLGGSGVGVLGLVCLLCMQQVFASMPRVRSALARTVLSRMVEDNYEKNSTHQHWYAVREQLIAERYCADFLQCDEDAETHEFLQNCYDKSDGVFMQLYHSVAKSFLSWMLPATTINGLLGRGSMFVLSTAQFHALLGVTPSWRAGKLLDLGAGDGKVTEKMAANFDEVYATEASSTMVWRLKEKGYKLLGIGEWAAGNHQYDVISCLNLLDRCDKPVSILKDIKRVLVPVTGRLIVALVLPFKPYVEYNENHLPSEYLHIQGETFEDHVNSFVKDIFEPSGFTLEKFSRLPYLCEGDLQRSFYILSDAVFVLKPT